VPSLDFEVFSSTSWSRRSKSDAQQLDARSSPLTSAQSLRAQVKCREVDWRTPKHAKFNPVSIAYRIWPFSIYYYSSFIQNLIKSNAKKEMYEMNLCLFHLLHFFAPDPKTTRA
jgi:hypothetical protein